MREMLVRKGITNTDTNHNRLFSTPSNLSLSSHDEQGPPIDTLRKYWLYSTIIESVLLILTVSKKFRLVFPLIMCAVYHQSITSRTLIPLLLLIPTFYNLYPIVLHSTYCQNMFAITQAMPVQCVRWSCAEAFLLSTQWRGIMDRGLEEDWMWSNQQQCSDHQSGVYDDGGWRMRHWALSGQRGPSGNWQITGWQFLTIWAVIHWTNTRLGDVLDKYQTWRAGGAKMREMTDRWTEI